MPQLMMISELSKVVNARANSVFVVQPSKDSRQSVVHIYYNSIQGYGIQVTCGGETTFSTRGEKKTNTKEEAMKKLAVFLKSLGMSIGNGKKTLEELNFEELKW